MVNVKNRILIVICKEINNKTLPIPKEIIRNTYIKLFFNNTKIEEIETRLERIATEKRKVYGRRLEDLQQEYWRLKSDLNSLYEQYPEYYMVNI